MNSKRIMIVCKTTRKPVFTGFAMDERSFASTSFEANSVGCPHCGQSHVWSKSDAYLEISRTGNN